MIKFSAPYFRVLQITNLFFGIGFSALSEPINAAVKRTKDDT